jgi:hypothetical protein
VNGPLRRRRMPLRRGAIAALGLIELLWGGWAYLAPASFFTDFPGFGHAWTGAYPPYNQHLTSDLGATFLTLGALLAIAAWRDDRRVDTVVLVGVLVFNALHLAYHAAHRGELTRPEYAESLLALIFGVLIPIGLLVATGRPRRSGTS